MKIPEPIPKFITYMHRTLEKMKDQQVNVYVLSTGKQLIGHLEQENDSLRKQRNDMETKACKQHKHIGCLRDNLEEIKAEASAMKTVLGKKLTKMQTEKNMATSLVDMLA